MAESDRLLSKPLLGGPFGVGRYALASVPIVDHGLHGVQFMVIDPRAGSVLSVAQEKTQAIADARRVIASAGMLGCANDDRVPAQGELWTDLPVPAATPVSLAHVPRRRREIFDRSQGKCFYCGTGLQLEGEWHIEHQMPRALGGTDAPMNLVAACVRCNLQKADSTALEYVARRGAQT
jgi:hypothetical protein